MRPEPLLRYIAHPPYRDNQCGRCHDPQGGQLHTTIQEGLCLVCHAKVAAEPKYLHGPVAVNDCGVCHHYHESRHPNLLLTDATATCLVCHDRDDLTTGDHHADLERRTCIECHNPHGGSDRFFLTGTANEE
jgi:predicted CXXCH cytochrome family protein